MAKAKSNKALVLRSCAENMTSHGGFVWPGVGEIAEAPDWQNNKKCGQGLHGWLYGQGDHSMSQFTDATAKWLVVEVDEADVVMLGGKCKFPRGKVVFVGTKIDAAAYIIEHEPRARNVAVIGAQLAAGDKESVLVGALGTATAGESGTATAGYRGTATAGESGTATAGNYGTATAGNYGTATAGYRGTATAGESGEIQIKWWDDAKNRYRTVIGYVGEDGIEADVPYVLDTNHKLVRKV
ncbi:Ice nucleation protein [Burkholderia lata]|uniref:Ice nucleation protein n=1 Tax=Burkholderia lata (strain ATCC 17760 / DSM 23089 / LMG 22485 / NCIMB 9086 / R18194 / 383) TaxID=482957 RepID=A0A6P2VVM0_BURL3|nr:hypothetical protein [Burkholderia lata]VWC95549.1 Ice nucleation protein [Burkholderia lata]